jgi:hypothetical protein
MCKHYPENPLSLWERGRVRGFFIIPMVPQAARESYNNIRVVAAKSCKKNKLPRLQEFWSG